MKKLQIDFMHQSGLVNGKLGYGRGFDPYCFYFCFALRKKCL